MTDFKVKYKKDGFVYTVYDVCNDRNGSPRFLIYIDGRWKYIIAKDFSPCDIVSTILNRWKQTEQEENKCQ